jgi:hypothetical protein
MCTITGTKASFVCTITQMKASSISTITETKALFVCIITETISMRKTLNPTKCGLVVVVVEVDQSQA